MKIRTMSRADLGAVLDWAAAEGWNPGLDDAEPFHAADPGGFFLAEQDGAPAAAISVVNHDAGFAFLGLYICRPQFRGQGIGYALWQAALEHAGSRTVGLDGVPAQQANYLKSGFAYAGSTRRLEGTPDEAEVSDIRPALSSDAEALLALDRAAQGYDRHAFLTAWLAPSGTRTTVVLDQLGAKGFATARLCREGCKIGPVIAPDTASALSLIAAASRIAPGTAIIDVPATNAALGEALSSQGFTETFATARMYRGPAPRSGTTAQAIATMELG